MGKKIILAMDHLVHVVEEMKRTGLKVTQKAVARRLHVDEYWFSHQLQDPEFRRFYEELINDSTQPPSK